MNARSHVVRALGRCVDHIHVNYRLGEDLGVIEMGVDHHDLVTWALQPTEKGILLAVAEYVELPVGAEILSFRLVS